MGIFLLTLLVFFLPNAIKNIELSRIHQAELHRKQSMTKAISEGKLFIDQVDHSWDTENNSVRFEAFLRNTSHQNITGELVVSLHLDKSKLEFKYLNVRFSRKVKIRRVVSEEEAFGPVVDKRSWVDYIPPKSKAVPLREGDSYRESPEQMKHRQVTSALLQLKWRSSLDSSARQQAILSFVDRGFRVPEESLYEPVLISEVDSVYRISTRVPISLDNLEGGNFSFRFELPENVMGQMASISIDSLIAR